MNVSGTMNSATGHTSVSTRTGNFNDGLYDKAGARPDLDLDFARTKSLKDRVSKEDLITFTRGTSRIRGTTYVDENGLVKRAGHNLLINSHNIGGSNWFLTTFSDGGTTQSVTQNTTETTAPNGMFEAAKIIIDSGTTAGRMVCISTGAYQDGGPIQVNDFIVASVYLKSATGQNQPVNVSISGTSRAVFTVTPEWQRFAIRAKRPTSAGTSAVGDYRIRIGIRNQPGSSGANQPDSDGNFSNLHAEFYAWGAQFEHDGTTGSNSGSAGYTGPIGELVKTTTQACGAPRFTHDPETLESKGLLIEKESINYVQTNTTLSAWGTSRSAITIDNSITNPDGTTGAPKITADATTGTRYVMAPAMTGPANTTKIRHSVFLKYGSHRFVDIYGNYNSWMTASTGVRVDLLNGTAVKVGVATSLTEVEEVKQFPNGWIKVTVKSDLASGITPTNKQPMYLWFIADGNPGTTTGTSGIDGNYFYAWGAQTETGNDFATSTIINETTGAVTRSPDLASIQGDNFGTYRLNQCKDSEPNALNFDETTVIAHAYDTVSPDGKFNASLLKEDTSGPGTHLVRWDPIPSLEDSTNYTLSCHFKEPSTNSRRYAGLTMHARAYVVFDLQTGTHVLTQNSSSGFVSQSITPVGETDSNGKPVNGWYRCSATFTTKSTANGGQGNAVYAFLHEDGQNNGQTYTGDGTKGMYVWGFQCEKGNTLTPYIPSTDEYTNRQSNATFVDGNGIIRTSYNNIISYSEDFTQSSFSKLNATVTPNATIAPDGTQTATKWIADTTAGLHRIQDGIGTDIKEYTASVFAKAGELTTISLRLGRANRDTEGVKFNLSTGAVIENGTLITSSSITSVGNGWYRLTLTHTPAHDTGQQYFVISEDETISAAGDGSSGFFIWGAQVVKGSEAGDYYKTTGTQSGPPRYSHDPYTLTPTGLYLEPAATNVWLNSEDVNSWSTVSTHGYAPTVDSNSALAPDGTQTADKVTFANITNQWTIKYQGTFTGTYTWSGWIKTADNTTKDIYLSWASPDSNRVHTFTATGEWQRFEAVVTPAGANVHIGNHHNLTPSSWNGGEFYIWGVQMEAGSVATSYIPTSGAQVTRSADTFTSTATEVLDKANGTKPAFYTKSGMTAFASAQFNNANGTSHQNSRVFGFSGGSSSFAADFQIIQSYINHMQLYQNTDLATGLTNFDISKPVKVAGRYDLNNSRLATNGTLSNLDNNHAIRSSNKLDIGKTTSSTEFFTNGTIQRITFWKTPFVDSKLQRLTS